MPGWGPRSLWSGTLRRPLAQRRGNRLAELVLPAPFGRPHRPALGLRSAASLHCVAVLRTVRRSALYHGPGPCGGPTALSVAIGAPGCMRRPDAQTELCSEHSGWPPDHFGWLGQMTIPCHTGASVALLLLRMVLLRPSGQVQVRAIPCTGHSDSDWRRPFHQEVEQ
jgi:hypothetical protein